MGARTSSRTHCAVRIVRFIRTHDYLSARMDADQFFEDETGIPK